MKTHMFITKVCAVVIVFILSVIVLKNFNIIEQVKAADAGPAINLSNQGEALTIDTYPNTFNFYGTATYTNPISSVEVRLYAVVNGAEDGWTACSADDAEWGGTTENFTCSIDVSGLEDGKSYIYEVRATDNSDPSITTRVDQYGKFGVLRIGTLPDAGPAVDLLVTGDITSGTTHSIEGTATYTNPISIVEYKLASGAENSWQACIPSDEWGTTSVDFTCEVTGLTDGANLYEVRATDNSDPSITTRVDQYGKFGILKSETVPEVGPLVEVYNEDRAGGVSAGDVTTSDNYWINVTATYTNPITLVEVRPYNVANGAEENWTACMVDTATTYFCHATGITNGNSSLYEIRASDGITTTRVDQYGKFGILGIGTIPQPGPGITLASQGYKTSQASYSITGTATYDTPIASVEIRSANGAEDSWAACGANDSSWDEDTEDFTCVVTGLVDGSSYLYEIRATDSSAVKTLADQYGRFGVVRDIEGAADAGPAISLSSQGETTTLDSYAITGTASFENPITSVDFRLAGDGDNWTACSAVDIFDSTSEGFSCNATDLVDETSYLYEIRASDGTTNTRVDQYGKFGVLRSGTPPDAGPAVDLLVLGDTTTGTSYQIVGTATTTSPNTISSVQFRGYDTAQTAEEGWTECGGYGFEDTNIASFYCQATGLVNGSAYLYEVRAMTVVETIDESDPENPVSSYVDTYTRVDQYGKFGIFENGEVVVDDSGPAVSFLLPNKAVITTNADYQIEGTASYSTNITAVQYRLYNSSVENAWQDCSAEDTFDSTSEGFTCSVEGMTDQTSYLYEIKASAGVDSTRADLYGKFSILRDSGNDLVSWFPMDQPELPGDSSGNHPVGSITNAVVGSNTGEFGKAFTFDQNKSTYTLTDPNSLLDFPGSSDQFNVNFWVKPTVNNSDRWHVLLAKRNTTDNANTWQISLSDTGHIQMAVYPPNDHGYTAETRTDTNDSLVNFGEWNQVVANYDALNRVISIRVNNNPSVRQNISSFYNNPSSNGNLLIGDSFEGELDDIRVYNTVTDYAVPEISVAALANPSRVTDSTPTFTVTITDDSVIASADYFIPRGGDVWVPLTPDDGAWDETEEVITFTTAALNDRTYSVYIRSADIYGNTHVYEPGFSEYGYSRLDVIPNYRFVIETVDSTPPDIFVYTIAPNPTINKNVDVRGFVKDYTLLNEGDTASVITDIKYRLDAGEWVTLDNANFDSSMEEFSVPLTDLALGDHTVEFQATDAAGNSTNPATNVVESFEVIAQPEGLSVKAESTEIDFRSHIYQDQLASSGVWGDGKLHLKPTIDFSYETLLPENYNLFGYQFGKAYVGVYPSYDPDFVWVSTDRGDFMYVNKTTKEYTLYPSIHDSRVLYLKDFVVDGNRLLFVGFNQAGQTVLYDTKGTMTDTSDDVYVGYDTKNGFNVNNRGFSVFAVDNSGPTTAFFVNLNNGEQAALADNNFIARIDTKNTYDIEDDTITYWGQSDGITAGDPLGSNDITGNYYDAERNVLILSSYHLGTYVCDLGVNSWDKSDDVCTLTTSEDVNTTQVFSIVKDNNNIYWMGGDYGLWTLDISDPESAVITEMVSKANMSNEGIQMLYWHEGDTPLGDEIMFVTREGHIRVFNYNSTYTDTVDDLAYDYSLPQQGLYRTGDGFGYFIEGKDTVWIGTQAKGVSRIDLTRSYEDENTVIIIPPMTLGMAAANYFRLGDIVGSVSAGSSFTLDELTKYYISNDAGTTWKQIIQGETVYFPTAGDQLRFKIVMTKGSTPILESIGLTFKSYATEEDAEVYDPAEMVIPTPTPTPTTNNNNSGNSSDSSSSGSGSSGSSAPCTNQKPGNLAPYIWKSESLGNGKIKLYYNDAARPITDYHIVFGTKSNKYTYGGIGISRYGDKTLIVSLLKPNTKYYFKLIPYNGCASGPWSNEVSIKSGGKYSVLTTNFKNTVSAVLDKITGKKTTTDTATTTQTVVPEYKSNIVQEQQTPVKESFFTKVLRFFGFK